MRIDPLRPSPGIIERAAAVIRDGGVVLYPSDTVYGLGCDPFNEKALRRLFEIKGRPEEKGVLLLIPDSSWISRLCVNMPEVFDELAKSFWPGPATMLFEARPSVLPGLVVGEAGKVGLRCPDLDYLLRWMEAIPGPLVSTSANRSQEPPPESLLILRDLFEDQVDLFLEAGDINQNVQPSTVVDLTTTPPVLVRRGRLSDEVEIFLSRFFAGRT